MSLLKNNKTVIDSALCKKTFFINQAKEVHGDRYSYNKLIYVNGNTKSTINCSIHGDFEQKPKSHLQGHGCPKCGDEIKGWTRTDFINVAKGKECILYVIKCWNENEEFYKIGITSRKIKNRFYNKNTMPYNYEILQEIKGEAGEIWDLEKKYKNLLKEYKYVPKIKFGGHATECINVNPLYLTDN